MKHVVILGCGRSGTSIFGELFEHITAYNYFSEPFFHDYLNFDFSKLLAVKVPRESENYPATPGLSFPLETLMSVVPNSLIIYWQVRQPLDAICSLRIGIANNWGHHPKPPDWQTWLDRPLVERCAHHWNYLNSVGFEQVCQHAQVKYFEDMIRAPQHFAETICAEVGLDIQENEIAITEWAARVQNTNNEHFIEAKTSRHYSRPDHKTRIDRWQENLSAQEVESIIPIVAQTASQFGYHLAGYQNT